MRCVGSQGVAGDATSDSPIGSGGTTAWKLCTLNNETSLAVYFEVANPGGKDQQPMAMQGQQSQQFFLQFLCTFALPTGRRACASSRRVAAGPKVRT